MWLFKLPLLRKTVYRAARNSAVISFVVDLPALPVTATTAAPESRRTRLASVCSAAIVSGTTTSGVPANSAAPVSAASLTIAPTAPLPTASRRTRCRRIDRRESPRTGRQATIVRVSIEKPDISRSPPGPDTFVPMAAATAAGVSVSAPAPRARSLPRRTAARRCRSSAIVRAPSPRAGPGLPALLS